MEQDEELRRAAVVLGRRGGPKGGPARAAKLSPARRHRIAVAGGRARWRHHHRRRGAPEAEA